LCHEDSECEEGGEAGTCQPGGLCSFPDGDCATGQKYGNHAGTVSGECVPNVSDTGATTGVASTSVAGSTSTGADPVGDTTVALDDSSTGAPPSTSTSESSGTESSSSGDSGPPVAGAYEPCFDDMQCPGGIVCAYLGVGDMEGLCLPSCADMPMGGMCPLHPAGFPVECGVPIGFDYCYVPCGDMAGCPVGLACTSLMGNPDGICLPP
jgi:hypothetical protein